MGKRPEHSLVHNSHSVNAASSLKKCWFGGLLCWAPGLSGSHVQGKFWEPGWLEGRYLSAGKNEDLGEATQVFMLGLSWHSHSESPRIVFAWGLGTSCDLAPASCCTSLCASALTSFSCYLTAIFQAPDGLDVPPQAPSIGCSLCRSTPPNSLILWVLPLTVHLVLLCTHNSDWFVGNWAPACVRFFTSIISHRLTTGQLFLEAWAWDYFAYTQHVQ